MRVEGQKYDLQEGENGPVLTMAMGVCGRGAGCVFHVLLSLPSGLGCF